jgi:predicted PurR-regulated permease PerM
MTEKTAGERFAAVLFYGVVLLLAYLLYQVFQPFLVPLGWAGVLVVVFYPLHVRLEKRLGRTPAAAASTLGVALILIGPALVLMTLFFREGVEALRNVQQAAAEGRFPWVERTWEWLRQRAPGIGPGDLATLVRQGAEGAAKFLAARLGTVLRNIAVFLFDLFVTLFALFYLFRDAATILAGIRRVLPFTEEHRDQMIVEARELIFATVTAGLLVAGVQGLISGIGFAVVGLGAPVFWGVLMGFFSLLPVIGAWVIWLPASIWLIATGHSLRGMALMAIGLGLVATVDNLLRPILIGGRARLSGLLVFISVLGGVSVFGLLGVVLGPIVVATSASILDVYTRRRSAA